MDFKQYLKGLTKAGRTIIQRSTASAAKCADVDALSETARSEKSAHGLVRDREPDGTLPSARSTHHSHLGTGRI